MASLSWLVAAFSALTAVAHAVAAFGFHRTDATFARNSFVACTFVWVGLTVFWATR